MGARTEWEDSRKWQALPDRRGGDSGSILHVYVAAVANLTPPSAVHVPWHVHVHAGVAVPGTLLNLQHSPAPSRVRNPHAMRVGVVVGRARGPDGLCLGMAVHPCCHCAPLSFASNKDVGLRTPVCRVLVVSRCVRDACHRVAECRSGGLGSGRKPVLCQCVSNACPRRGALCLALVPCCDDCLILLLLYYQDPRHTACRSAHPPCSRAYRALPAELWRRKGARPRGALVKRV